MSNVIPMRRKPRPLTKTYDPKNPYVVDRTDYESGTIVYEVWDNRQATYRLVSRSDDDHGRDPYAKWNAEQIARGLNFLVQCGKEQLPKVKERDDYGPDDDEDDDGE